jgi:hypothetical protein
MTVTCSLRRLLTPLFAVCFAVLALSALSPAPTASAHHGGTHYLHLVKLVCIQTEDSTGADEAYIRVAGTKVWSGDINDNQTKYLDWLAPRAFTTQALIQLYDADTGMFDSDDFLGEHTVYAWEAGQEHTIQLTEDGAEYHLTYRVK